MECIDLKRLSETSWVLLILVCQEIVCLGGLVVFIVKINYSQFIDEAILNNGNFQVLEIKNLSFRNCTVKINESLFRINFKFSEAFLLRRNEKRRIFSHSDTNKLNRF